MSSSYINMLFFLIATWVYYYFRSTPKTVSEYKSFKPTQNREMLMYFGATILIQFAANASIIVSTCGGNVSENMGAAAWLTVIPWFLMFGTLLIVLSVFPGVKSMFSDIVGYFYVSSKATDVLANLLKPTTGTAGTTGTTGTTDEPTTRLLTKIYDNQSLLINKMVPSNFETYMNSLTPLLNEKADAKAKEDLFQLVVTRDTIGEAMWFIYTGLLVSSFVQMKLTLRGCKTSVDTMEKNYQQFLKDEETAKKEKELATSTTYTLN